MGTWLAAATAGPWSRALEDLAALGGRVAAAGPQAVVGLLVMGLFLLPAGAGR